MRHRRSGYKLGRNTAHRRALLRNMAVSLITHEEIETTVTKAKFLRPYVEKLVTIAKQGTLHARRRVIAEIGRDPIPQPAAAGDATETEKSPAPRAQSAVHKLFQEIAPRFQDRKGGYTRIIRMPRVRLGDAAPVARIQFVAAEPATTTA